MSIERAYTDRVRYSPIVDRPKLEWPNDARVAVWICPNVMYYQYRPQQDTSFRWPWTRTDLPDVRGYSLQDFGNREGFWRMLRVLDQYPITPTCALNASVLQIFPDIRDAMVARSWEYMSHGMYNTEFVYGYSRDDELKFHTSVRDTILAQTGQAPGGALGPGPQSVTVNTPDVLAQLGYSYMADWHHDDQPVEISTESGRLVSVPYSQGLADSAFFSMGWEAADFARAMKAHFDQLYKEGSESGRVFCLCLHAYVIAQPHRIRYLNDILEHVLSHDKVWVTTAANIADYYISRYVTKT